MVGADWLFPEGIFETPETPTPGFSPTIPSSDEMQRQNPKPSENGFVYQQDIINYLHSFHNLCSICIGMMNL